MRIPDGKWTTQFMPANWTNAADKMGMEYGIFISVGCERSVVTKNITRVYFKVEDHEFDSLRELRKVLRMKVFL